ncbi:MAG: LLM class flavin-dependent oxidoreductase, partial [Myxococcota bacterium]
MQRSLLYQVGQSGAEAGIDLESWVSDLHLAEELGLESAWCFPAVGESGDFQGSAPEVWLAALAARTERLRLGWGVPGLMPPAKPPLRVAEQAAALDLACQGRLDFAVLPGAAGAEVEVEVVEAAADAAMGEAEPGAPAGWDEGARMLVEMWDA